MSKKCFYLHEEARQKMPYLVHFYPIHQKPSFFLKSSKLQGFWINSRALRKNSRIWRKNSSFLTLKLNEPVVANNTRYHKSVKKKACSMKACQRHEKFAQSNVYHLFTYCMRKNVVLFVRPVKLVVGPNFSIRCGITPRWSPTHKGGRDILKVTLSWLE